MPWGYRLLAIFLAVHFIGWLVMVVWWGSVEWAE
jgi:hypothetical protein